MSPFDWNGWCHLKTKYGGQLLITIGKDPKWSVYANSIYSSWDGNQRDWEMVHQFAVGGFSWFELEHMGIYKWSTEDNISY